MKQKSSDYKMSKQIKTSTANIVDTAKRIAVMRVMMSAEKTYQANKNRSIKAPKDRNSAQRTE